MTNADVMTFSLTADRTSPDGSTAQSKEATLLLDTSATGRIDALNPVELLLAALSACIIKGIDRVAPTIGFSFSSVHVELVAHRPASEARITDISYVVTVATPDVDKLDLVHKNIRKFGTISNTVSAGTNLTGTVVAA